MGRLQAQLLNCHPGHEPRADLKGILVNIEVWRMHIGGNPLLLVSSAESVKCCRYHLRVVCKVFGAERIFNVHNVFRPEISHRSLTHPSRQFGIVFEIRVPSGYSYLATSAHSGSNAFRHLLDALQCIVPPRFVHGTEGSGDVYLVRDDVCRTIRNNLSECEHRGLLRTCIPTDDLLQRHNNVRCNDYRVDRKFRPGAMTTLADDAQINFVGTCHKHSLAKADLARVKQWIHVLTDDSYGSWILKGAVADHV